MEYLCLVSDSSQMEQYQVLRQKFEPKMDDFLTFLREQYAVHDLPKAVILTSYETATQKISQIPVPAYTNEMRTVFCPELAVWQKLYRRQLSSVGQDTLRRYYESCLSENHVLQILGHEFVHHSDLFLDDAYEKGIWFEEGMCEYISRKFFLTEAEFDREIWANSLLVQEYETVHGERPLTEFGSETYQQDYAGIFYGYWKSFLAVQKLISHHNGDIPHVFQEYHRWSSSGTEQTLAHWFGLE